MAQDIAARCTHTGLAYRCRGGPLGEAEGSEWRQQPVAIEYKPQYHSYLDLDSSDADDASCNRLVRTGSAQHN